MFDVVASEYDEASFFTRNEPTAVRRTSPATSFLTQSVVDPRMSLALTSLALGLAATGVGSLISIGAAAALILSMIVRPLSVRHDDKYGAFDAVELGFLLWSCDRHSPFASAASAMFATASFATLCAGITGTPEQVVLCGAISFMGLIVARLSLASMVRGAKG
ncbi:hypothetical protein H0I76_00355 [Limibaculum sp. M0105]|uniref:Uncharacterized protein n=1 Tax=Thermohalobaculum xanthum TaxID=2753746 RepID=A0A8J7M4R8_9RHOB|nr:hypothetical protein [Thermohalobaculum xanthum]MBK0397627.1 hypothetical protein [Thermohalobaculum xanthum]